MHNQTVEYIVQREYRVLTARLEANTEKRAELRERLRGVQLDIESQSHAVDELKAYAAQQGWTL